MFGQKVKLALGFLKYYLGATNRHGLQAPFAYALNEAVFRSEKLEKVPEPIEQLRQKLKADERVLQVRDYGAGFGGTVFRELSVAYIARHAAKPPRYARMLYRLVKHLQPGVMLELGTSLGISALYQSVAAPASRMITLEGCPATAQVAKENFAKFPHLNIEMVEGGFRDTLPGVLSGLSSIDYLYIDGHHRLAPTLAYIDSVFPFLSEHAVLVVDDINWSEEMQDAWQRLKKDARFTLSIDVYMMGLLFISKDLSKEDFTVRY